MKIAVYCVESGNILRVVKCDPDHVDLQVGPGEAFVECDDHSDLTHRVEAGLLVEIEGGSNADHV